MRVRHESWACETGDAMRYVELDELTGEVTWDAYFEYLRSTGLGDDSIRYGDGEDAVQALTLTLKRIGVLLYTSSEAKSGLLTWNCATTAGDLGFPVPESVRQQAPP